MPATPALVVAQNLYVIYYGRPADYAGLQYWAGRIDSEAYSLPMTQIPMTQIPNDILAAFANSAESQALYGNDNATQLVNAAYQTMFNRAPDPSGLAFWVNAISTGQYTFINAVNAIANAAGGNDAATLLVKEAAAPYFTNDTLNYGNDNGAWFAGATAVAYARNFLAPIDLHWNGYTGVNAQVGTLYQEIG